MSECRTTTSRSAFGWHLPAALLLACFLASPAPAQLCFNSARYFDLFDDATSFPFCHDGIMTCQTPILGAPQYTVEPDCDPFIESCAVKVEVDVEFPGNHQNDPLIVGLGYSFGTLLLTDGGTVIDACGVAGATIRKDHGRFEYSRSVTCLEAASLQLELESTMCPCAPNVPICPWQACEKKATVFLDLGAPLGEECKAPPPPQNCGDSECVNCPAGGTGGGGGPGGAGGPGAGGGPGGGGGAGGGGGGGPGGGGKGGGCSDGGGIGVGGVGASACPEDGGPGATPRYHAGGAGHPDFPGTPEWNRNLGRYWSHDAAERIVEDPDASHVWLITRFASFREFSDGDGDGAYEVVAPSDEYRRLFKTATGWELRFLDGTVQSFDAGGRWTGTADRWGNASVASYAGLDLTSVDFPDGRSETFTYHPGGKLATMTEVGIDGTTTRAWGYTWSGDDLIRIDRPDGTAWEFLYDDPDLPGYMTRMTLVGTDASRREHRGWQYDDFGNAIKTWRGAAGPADPDAWSVWSFDFNVPLLPTETTVTDPLGNVSIYAVERDTASIKSRVARITGDCPVCGLGPNAQLFYEDPSHPLRVTRAVDGRGTTTLFTYDANGMLRSVTEATGSPLERTTTFEYQGPHPSLLTAIEQPSTTPGALRRESFGYDAAGNPVTLTLEGVEAGDAFSYTTTNSFSPQGQPETVDPPGHGTADAAHSAYDPQRGNLVPLSRTFPLIGTTSFDYDPFNQQNRITDFDGVATELEYDDLRRLESVVRKGATGADDLVTMYEYTPFGDLFRITMPEGNVIQYDYDPAGRRVAIERRPDAGTAGERALLTPDALGRVLNEQRQRWDGAQWLTDFTQSYVYSGRCGLLSKVVHADGSVTELDYDCNGNVDRLWDANHPSNGQTALPTARYVYDVLDRLTAIIQPWAGSPATVTTAIGYDIQDNLTSWTDGEGNLRTYVFSDRGLLTRQAADVLGTVEVRYNEHGVTTEMTDAKGITVHNQLDLLDRLTFVDFPGSALDVRYTYDDASVPFSADRLTRIERAGTVIDYRYDRFGRTVQDGALSYAYDRNGNRTEIAYPDGTVARYTHDFADRETSLTVEEPGQPAVPVATGGRYLAWGDLYRLDLGNGVTETREYDQRFFPTRITATRGGTTLLDWSFINDAIGNPTQITDHLDPARTRLFGYLDSHYFLSQATGPWGDLSWTYNRNGSRLSETRDGATTTFHYRTNPTGGKDLRLQGLTLGSGEATDVLYDAAANQLSQGRSQDKVQLDHDETGLLAGLAADGSQDPSGRSRIDYDGRGFLNLAEYFSPFDADPLFSTRATYSSDGLLRSRIATSRAGATTARDLPTTDDSASIFYFAGRPLALLENEVTDPGGGGAPVSHRALLYVTTDQIGTPAMACEETGVMRWNGGFEPFGADFAGAQEAGVFLRFLGQWQDDAWQQAAGPGPLYYNVHRWYQADNGWYLELDPIELESGVSLYVYAQSNPIVVIDPLGLFGLADIPAPPDWVGNFSAGFGDVLLFGFGDDLRGFFFPDAAALIDQCSSSYKWGEGAGFAASLATGFAGGVKAAGTSAGGKVSHTGHRLGSLTERGTTNPGWATDWEGG